ncbi:MAG: hypothetical protein B6I35_13415 [Anaerolineaceae bacterium 4572_32.2]|nr:MAG: hypothetical protein B6I35_13415 [Anaerolineaceae bacterium 4572_32.2]HEY73403.1 universal stress protein [Thermoflexia bacterium]
MFDHILVPLDGSSLAECVLPHVIAIARALEARVTLLQVLERPHGRSQSQFVEPLDWYMGAAEARTYLNTLAARLQKADLQVETAFLEGQAAERIIEFARDQSVGLIILSSHGRSGLSGWNVSSIVLKIILRAYLPVMIVRAYQPPEHDLMGLRYRRLLVPLDCSQRAECVLPLATALARFHEAELLAGHVVTRPQMPHRAPLLPEERKLATQIIERNRLEATRYLRQLQPRLDVRVRTHIAISDHAAATLHDLVEQADVDLVVLSAHGYSGSVKWPYGSLAVNFISYGATPLLIVQDFSPEEVEYTQAEMFARERKGH